MAASQWLGILGGLLFVGFIFFAFRKGNKVKSDGTGNIDRGSSEPPDQPTSHS
jgi:cbb3-type cytochrome oxidase subunit 3